MCVCVLCVLCVLCSAVLRVCVCVCVCVATVPAQRPHSARPVPAQCPPSARHSARHSARLFFLGQDEFCGLNRNMEYTADHLFKTPKLILAEKR